MNPLVFQTYNTATLAPLLEALLTRLGPAENSPVQQQPIADDLRLWVSQLRRQPAAADLEAERWQAFGAGEYLTVVGKKAGLSARWAGEEVDRITVQQPDRRWTFEFFASALGPAEQAALRVTICSEVQVIRQSAFAVDGTYQDERDWHAQIVGALSHLKEALQKGNSPFQLPGPALDASPTPPATNMDSAHVARRLSAATVAAAAIVGPVLQRTPSPAMQMLQCAKCHTKLEVGAKFCTHCGERVAAAPPPQSPTTCKTCGSSLPPGGKFCATCGAHI